MEQIIVYIGQKAHNLLHDGDTGFRCFMPLGTKQVFRDAESAYRKLSALTEPEFSTLSFTLADEDVGGE